MEKKITWKRVRGCYVNPPSRIHIYVGGRFVGAAIEVLGGFWVGSGEDRSYTETLEQAAGLLVENK